MLAGYAFGLWWFDFAHGAGLIIEEWSLLSLFPNQQLGSLLSQYLVADFLGTDREYYNVVLGLVPIINN